MRSFSFVSFVPPTVRRCVPDRAEFEIHTSSSILQPPPRREKGRRRRRRIRFRFVFERWAPFQFHSPQRSRAPALVVGRRPCGAEALFTVDQVAARKVYLYASGGVAWRCLDIRRHRPLLSTGRITPRGVFFLSARSRFARACMRISPPDF